jgi:hypothetical protein
MTTVVNVKKTHLTKNGYRDFTHWKKNVNNVYIGRNMSFYVDGAIGSKWQNPFKIKNDTLENVLDKYEQHIRSNKELYNSLHELDGKTLGCWCKPNKCHGDVLINLLKEIS